VIQIMLYKDNKSMLMAKKKKENPQVIVSSYIHGFVDLFSLHLSWTSSYQHYFLIAILFRYYRMGLGVLGRCFLPAKGRNLTMTWSRYLFRFIVCLSALLIFLPCYWLTDVKFTTAPLFWWSLDGVRSWDRISYCSFSTTFPTNGLHSKCC
jgi:hypothetical protein